MTAIDAVATTAAASRELVKVLCRDIIFWSEESSFVRGASPENTIMSSLSEKSKGLRLSCLEIYVYVIYPFNKFTAIHSSKLISGTLLPVFLQVFLKRNYELPCWICGKHGGRRQIQIFFIFLFTKCRATGGGGGSSVMAVNTCILY
jgi:hypothetical protein